MNMDGIDALGRCDVVMQAAAVPVRDIIAACANAWGITVDLILSPRRSGHLAVPRHAAMYLTVRMRPDLTLPAIARLFKRSDHTTVIYAFRKVAAMRAQNKDYAKIVDGVENLLRGRAGNA